MDAQTIDAFRRRLLDRRESVLRRRRQVLSDEQTLLEDRESDWVDRAANQSGAASLDALADTEARVIMQIEASLARIAQGTFGDCVVCHGSIETERLRAIPEGERCAGCTH